MIYLNEIISQKWFKGMQAKGGTVQSVSSLFSKQTAPMTKGLSITLDLRPASLLWATLCYGYGLCASLLGCAMSTSAVGSTFSFGCYSESHTE